MSSSFQPTLSSQGCCSSPVRGPVAARVRPADLFARPRSLPLPPPRSAAKLKAAQDAVKGKSGPLSIGGIKKVSTDEAVASRDRGC